MRPIVVLARLTAVFVYSAAFCLTLIKGGKVSILMAVALIFIPFALIQPSAFFIFFMVARPLADVASKVSVLGMNPASWVTLIFMAFCVKESLREDIRTAPHDAKLLRNFNRYFAFLLFLYIPSFLHTTDMQISVMDIVRIVSVGLAINYLLKGFYRQPKDVDIFCKMALLSGVVPMALGLYQWVFDKGRHIEGYNRIYGTFTHPNVFAEYLLFIFFVCLYVLRHAENVRSKRLPYFIYMACVLFCLYQTYTRTMWIAFAACIVLYALIQRKGVSKGALLLTIGGFMVVALPLIQSRFADITGGGTGGRKSSLEWRMNLWRQTIGELKDHPWVGNGLGMYEHKIGVMAHNDFLRMAYETGLVATLAYVAGFLLLILYALRESRRSEGDAARESRLQISICLIAGFLISSLADNMLRSTVILFYYFTTLILFLAKPPQKAVL